ncbi:MAG TPA: hypothetical protein VFQ68_24140 [Streptosporangiaceae bacterium]|nr:hypothetical protein [Streptosporangiaceae bacterium]
MAKAVPVEVRIADLPQFRQFISSVATLLGTLAGEGGDLPEIARLAADQVKRDMAALGGRDVGPPLAASDEDRIRGAMAEAQDHPGRTITR